MSRPRLIKDWWALGVLFCLGFAGACAFALINPILLPKYLTSGVSFFFLISLCGALGGILYSTKHRLIEIPHHDSADGNKISLGYFADILGGIGGAYVIFLLLPYEFHQVIPGEGISKHAGQDTANRFLAEFELIRSLIQIIAVSMIGGYGGRALIERVQSTLLKDMEETIQRTQSLETNIQKADEARTLGFRIIDDPKHPPSEGEINIFKTKLAEVQFATRSEIFFRALSSRESQSISLIESLDSIKSEGFTMETFDQFFTQNAKKLGQIGDTMQASITLFKCLLETAPTESTSEEASMIHRYHAQLAYAKKDLLYCRDRHFDNPTKWSEIIRHLDKAIELRPTDEKPSSSTDSYTFYELNKAIALIERDGNYAKGLETSARETEEIIVLLRKALSEAKRRNMGMNMIFPVNVWLARNPRAKTQIESLEIARPIASTATKIP